MILFNDLTNLIRSVDEVLPCLLQYCERNNFLAIKASIALLFLVGLNNACNVTHIRSVAATATDNHVLDLISAREFTCDLKIPSNARIEDFASRDVDVLVLNSTSNIIEGQPGILKQIWIDIDAYFLFQSTDDICSTDFLERLELVL